MLLVSDTPSMFVMMITGDQVRILAGYLLWAELLPSHSSAEAQPQSLRMCLQSLQLRSLKGWFT